MADNKTKTTTKQDVVTAETDNQPVVVSNDNQTTFNQTENNVEQVVATDIDTALNNLEQTPMFENNINTPPLNNDIQLNPDDVLKESDEDAPIKTVLKNTKKYIKSVFDKEKVKKKKKKFSPLPIESVERFETTPDKGLTTLQVEERNNQDLTNYVEQKYSKTYANIIFTNTCTFFNFLCVCVAIAMACFHAPISNFMFVIVLILNTMIGIIQEVRAKKAIDKLKLMSSNSVKVIRNNVEIDIATEQIVLDDIIILPIGSQVPTDCTLIEGSAEVNESLLTGESIAVKKSIGSTLYAGSFITSGYCKVRAEKVGQENYISKLSAKAKKYKKPNSELMRSLKLIITVIGIIIIPIAVALFFNNYDGKSISDAVLRTSTVIIGMIPSGMFLLTSLALSLGVIRLSKNNTMVNDLYSLEMLARVDVLCLDKTGTITDGRMKVNDCIILNSNTPNTIGEAMGSLLNALNDNNQTSLALYNHFGYNNILTPVTTLPFSSKRKLSGVTFAESGTYIIGAPEFVLKEVPEKIQKLILQYTSLGLRVIILAHSKLPIVDDEPPAALKPIALITLTDNIREDAVSTIKWFKENDVQVKVISGDNPITVAEIARRVGIENADKYISLEGLSDREIVNIANKYTVFGRVTPEQKAILVKAMKSAGSTVAMTGDGVNDILALKESDCAITVASGSEAARNVANLVLMDSNFSSMPKVVHEGRRVINNVQESASLYLMKTIFTTVFALLCLAMQIKYPFTLSMMNVLELVVIGLASFCLSIQANDKRVEGKFINYVFSRAFPNAILMLFSVLAVQIFKIVMASNGTAVVLDNGQVNEAIYSTMSIIALTFASLICLYRQCQPFNIFRGIMFTVIFIIVFAWAIYFKTLRIGSMQIFPDLVALKEHWHHIIFLITVIIADLPLSGLIFTLLNKIKHINRKK